MEHLRSIVVIVAMNVFDSDSGTVTLPESVVSDDGASFSCVKAAVVSVEEENNASEFTHVSLLAK